MELLTQETIRALIEPVSGPCISIYQPTHRHHPDNQKDPIEFKNLVREVEHSLRLKFSGRETRPFMEPLHRLQEDAKFWNHTLDGLAVLASSDAFHVFQFPRAVRPLAVVADSFHVKPLIRIVQSADHFQVLCLSRQQARMLDGNRYGLEDIDVPDFPSTIKVALGDELTKPFQTVATTGSQGGAVFHGHGSKKDEVDKDTERYFRAVDRAVFSTFSKPSGLPLILVALQEHQPVFRAVSQNHLLLPHGVSGNPDSMAPDNLREAVWQAVEPQYLARLAKLSEDFSNAVAHQKATGDLSDAAVAAVAGKIGTLLIEDEKIMPGRLDPASGAISDAPLENPEIGDMLDDLAEVVLRNRGEVIVVPAGRMPTKTGLAAILRY